MGKNKIGICEWQLPINGPASFSVAKEMGFDGVHILDLGGAANNNPLNNKKIQDIYKRYAEEAEIKIHTLQLRQLVVSGNVKSAPNTEGSRDAIAAIKNGIDVCKALGIECLMVENFFASAIENENDIENTAKFLGVAGELTSEKGIKLIYESFMPVEQTMELYEMANRSFKMSYDNLNPLKYGFGNPLDELKKYPLEMIDHIHVKDAHSDYVPSTILGEGVGLVNDVAELLNSRNYDGWIVSYNYYNSGELSQKRDVFESIKMDRNILKKIFY